MEPEYDENGVDLSLIDETLRMTPEERLRANQRLLNMLWALGHRPDDDEHGPIEGPRDPPGRAG